MHSFKEFAPEVEESFDPNYHVPVPGDNGFQNPLYGDLFNAADGDDIEEVQGKSPPSFLDTIGFTPEDMDEVINSAEVSGAASGINDVNLDFGSGKDESEA